MISHVFINFETVQIYDLSYNYSITLFTIYRNITKQRTTLMLAQLIAQLVEHCTGIAKVHHGFESHSGLNFFQALISQLLKLRI